MQNILTKNYDFWYRLSRFHLQGHFFEFSFFWYNDDTNETIFRSWFPRCPIVFAHSVNVLAFRLCSSHLYTHGSVKSFGFSRALCWAFARFHADHGWVCSWRVTWWCRPREWLLKIDRAWAPPSSRRGKRGRPCWRDCCLAEWGLEAGSHFWAAGLLPLCLTQWKKFVRACTPEKHQQNRNLSLKNSQQTHRG